MGVALEPPPGYVTQAEACRRLSITYGRLTTLICHGAVEAVNDPRVKGWWIKDTSLRRFGV